jgi:hypothetical protein
VTEKGDIMAKVTLCDRCGKPITLTGMRKLTFRKICLIASLFDTGREDYNYDLCPDCALELEKFFEGKATDAVVKE